MKITDVKAFYIEVPFNEPGLESITAPGVVHKSWGFTAVKVFTDEGIVGYGGQNTRFGKWGPHWTEYINLVVGPQLVEREFDPFLVGKYSEEIVSQPPSFISPRPACVEMAMWDIIGKAAGQPLYRLFGAKKNKVKAYASSFPQYPRWGPKEWANWAETCRKEGFQAIKVKQNHPDIEKDIENIEGIRSAVGSPTKRSVAGSKVSFRPSSWQMLAIWHVAFARCAPSAGAIGRLRDLTQSRKFRTWFSFGYPLLNWRPSNSDLGSASMVPSSST